MEGIPNQKRRDQQKLERKKAEFFASGGEVKRIPTGVSGVADSPYGRPGRAKKGKPTKQARAALSGVMGREAWEDRV